MVERTLEGRPSLKVSLFPSSSHSTAANRDRSALLVIGAGEEEQAGNKTAELVDRGGANAGGTAIAQGKPLPLLLSLHSCKS